MAYFSCGGGHREDDAFQLCFSSTALAPCYLWLRCFVHERSQRSGRGAGASAFLFQPLCGCEAAWSRGSPPGPGQAGLFHPKSKSTAAPLLPHQQLAEDQPQLVSALFGSAGHNLERQEVQASSLGCARKGHSLGPLRGQLVSCCLNASLG